MSLGAYNPAVESIQAIEGMESVPWFSDKRKAPFVIGVTGGTASGKTTVCDRIIDALETHKVQLVSMDSFYRDLTEEQKQIAHAGDYNFDHPAAFDFALMANVLANIRECRPTDVPVYDFSTHSRHPTACTRIGLVDVVILEGIMILHDEAVRNMCDIKIFVEVDSDLRLLRRLKRDIVERGRTTESVLEAYERFVKPMHDQFIQPTMAFADIIVPRGAENQVAIDILSANIRGRLHEEDLQAVYPNMFVTGPRRQVKALLTPLRERTTDRKTFCFLVDRLCRLVVEEALGHLPLDECRVETPLGLDYVGLKPGCQVCGVSIVRAGESMETALRQVLKEVPIGKILMQKKSTPAGDMTTIEELNGGFEVLYSKYPRGIADGYVLLMDPVIGGGQTACRAIADLIAQGVAEDRIIFLNLLCTPVGVQRMMTLFPGMRLVTCEVDRGLTHSGLVYPGIGNFGDRYYGTERF